MIVALLYSMREGTGVKRACHLVAHIHAYSSQCDVTDTLEFIGTGDQGIDRVGRLGHPSLAMVMHACAYN